MIKVSEFVVEDWSQAIQAGEEVKIQDSGRVCHPLHARLDPTIGIAAQNQVWHEDTELATVMVLLAEPILQPNPDTELGDADERCHICAERECYTHCQNNPNGVHKGDPTTFRVDMDGMGGAYLDIECEYCHLSGCVGHFQGNDVNWG